MARQEHRERDQQPPPPPPPPTGQPRIGRFCNCHRLWIQHHQLNLQLLSRVHDNSREDEQVVRSAVARAMECYLDYYRARARLAEHNTPSVFSPATCTSEFENSYSWLGGYRPMTYIRLVYAVSGLEARAQLPDLLQTGRDVNLVGLSAHQLNSISALQQMTVRLEDDLSKRMASLQEAMADQPLVGLLLLSESQRARPVDVQSALKEYANGLHGILERADKLRLTTLMRVLEILSPLQGLHLLIMVSRFHLRLHEWGHSWDRMHQNG